MDLASGQVRPLWDGLERDQQEGWAIFGPYANFDWTPDSQSVVIWAQGKLWRVDMASGKPAQIPFRAEVEQKLAMPIRVEHTLEGDSFTPKMLRDVTRVLVF